MPTILPVLYSFLMPSNSLLFPVLFFIRVVSVHIRGGGADSCVGEWWGERQDTYRVGGCEWLDSRAQRRRRTHKQQCAVRRVWGTEVWADGQARNEGCIDDVGASRARAKWSNRLMSRRKCVLESQENDGLCTWGTYKSNELMNLCPGPEPQSTSDYACPNWLSPACEIIHFLGWNVNFELKWGGRAPYLYFVGATTLKQFTVVTKGCNILPPFSYWCRWLVIYFLHSLI
jgi:hypothetical protein